MSELSAHEIAAGLANIDYQIKNGLSLPDIIINCMRLSLTEKESDRRWSLSLCVSGFTRDRTDIRYVRLCDNPEWLYASDYHEGIYIRISNIVAAY